MMPAPFFAPRVQPVAAASPTALPPATAAWALTKFNALLALGASAGALRPGTELAAHTLRLQLHQAGVTMRGWPLPPGTAPRPLLPAGLAAALWLAGCDADLDRLRAWASLAAATRWAAEAGGRPMPPEAFYGAKLRPGTRPAQLQLNLTRSSAPLVLPVLNLVTFDWRYADPQDRRPACEVVLDVGPLWRALPVGRHHAALLGEMAAVLWGIREQGHHAADKRSLLRRAAVELHGRAGLPGPIDGSGGPGVGTPRPVPEAPRPPSAGAPASPPSGPQRAPAACAEKLPAPARPQDARWAHGGSRSAPAGACTPAERATPPAAPHGAVVRATRPNVPVSAQALQLALNVLASAEPAGAAGVAAGQQSGRASPILDATPTPQSSSAPSSRHSAGSASPHEVWADAPEDLAPAHPRATGAPPAVDAPKASPSPVEAELRRLNEAAAAVAWALLAEASRSVTQQLSEARALSLLAEPPAAALPPASVAVAGLWLRRLASRPVQAQAFLRSHGEAVVRWSQYPALLRDLGRVLGCWRDASVTPPAVESWLMAAGRAERGAPLLQTLASLGQHSPLHDEVLVYVSRQAGQLAEETVTALVRLLGDKLGNKRAASRPGRQSVEDALACVVAKKPAACHGLDFRRAYAWRVLSASSVEARALGFGLALAPAMPGAATEAPRTPAEVHFRLVACSATPDLQLKAAATLLGAFPRNVALAKLVAAMVAEHAGVLTTLSDKPGTTFSWRDVCGLVDVCAAVAESWHGDGRTVAETIWFALERVGFGLPHFLARHDYSAAAGILHRAQGHPHLHLRSLQNLAEHGETEVIELLCRALDGVEQIESRRVALRTEALALASQLGTRVATPAYVERVARAERELTRRRVGCNAWKAVAATRALLQWADAEPRLEDFFAADGATTAAFDTVLYAVSQREQRAPWLRGERPMRKLTELLRHDAQHRGQLAQILVDLVADGATTWSDKALLLPMLQATLDATPEPAARRAHAEAFGAAFGLWRVELLTAPLPAGDNEASARHAARAAAAYALAPALLASAAAAHPGPTNALEDNVRCARLHAALIHTLREPNHCGWRVPHLLERVAAAGGLTEEGLHRTARSALRDVASEVWAQGDLPQRGSLTAITFDLAWSLCCPSAAHPTLALAVFDGLLQVMDASDDRNGSFCLLRPMLKLERSAPSASDARERQLDVLLKHLWRATLRAKVTPPEGSELQPRLASAEVFSVGVAQGLCRGLHTLLDDPEPEGVVRRYRALAEAWYPVADELLYNDPGYSRAAAAIRYACADPELRGYVQAALWHPPGARPLLRVD